MLGHLFPVSINSTSYKRSDFPYHNQIKIRKYKFVSINSTSYKRSDAAAASVVAADKVVEFPLIPLLIKEAMFSPKVGKPKIEVGFH